MILDTHERWNDFCEAMGIDSPFQREQELFKARCSYKDENGWKVLQVRDFTEEEEQLMTFIKEWKKDYLRLEHKFDLWDYHFWMTWDEFEPFLKEYGSEIDYYPCDCAERQCALTCQYFGKECPRAKEELKSPISGLDGRWEID